jgi:N-acetylmuramic acid 6-phosphate etherase
MTPAQPLTEQHLPGLEGFDTWDNERILRTLLQGQHRALEAVEQALPALSKAADAIAPRIASGGLLIYAGAGTSIRVGVQDGTELPATFGTRADAEDNEQQARIDAEICTSKDAVIAIAASGRTPYTIAVATAAKARGCLVVAVVNNAGSALAAVADIEILLDSGPEVISGSTRMGAGTAQKAALNLLSTLVNTKVGAVYDGLMVNVEAGNSKLAERAARIVKTIAGASDSDALTALEQGKGQVKLAVLLLRGAKDRAAAQQLLSAAKGNLRLALANLQSQI